MPFTYAYPRPAVTADSLIFRECKKGYELLLIQRGRPPFQGMWALPGGFLDMDETLEECALRELKEETGLQGIELHQFKAYSAIDRDPRQRTIGIAFIGIADPAAKANAGDDAADAEWFELDKLPDLAFDHTQIVSEAIMTLPAIMEG